MRSDQGHAAVALAGLVVALVACKYSYTPPGSREASVDAAIADVADEDVVLAAEDPPDAHTQCSLHFDKPACLQNGKAKVCGVTRGSRAVGDWRVFSCPDCTMKDSQPSCSSLMPGDFCQVASAHPICTNDKRAMYACDYSAHAWKIEACPGGCTDRPPFDPTCLR